MNTHLTLKSGNKKTGLIPVSTTDANSCPTSCPLNSHTAENAGGCYAESGPLAMHWRKVTSGERGMAWDAFLDAIRNLAGGQLWRHNQAGDLQGFGDYIAGAKLAQLTAANLGRKGFTYTHKPLSVPSNLTAIREANQGGFTVNVSTNTVEEIDSVPIDLPVVTLLPIDAPKLTHTPKGRRVVTCPATYRETSCAECALCADSKRSYAIGFPAHGASKRKAEAIATA
jgi:hypothetical protein